MAEHVGLWVYAVDRRDEVPARERMIRDFADAAGTVPVICRAYSTGMGPIRVHQLIADAATKYAGREHVILVVMHEGLKMSDLGGFTGWKLIIDEIPDVWDSGSVCSPSLYRQLEACYRLEEPKKKPKDKTKMGWSKVVMLPDAPSVADLIKDHTMAPWVLFHRRVKSRQGVHVSLKNWSDSVDGEAWQWYSIWNPSELAAFDDVWIVGNCFTQTVTYKLLKHFFGGQIDFVPFKVGGGVTFVRRKLTIRYFTSSHRAAAGLFQSPEGQDCIRRWAKWVHDHSQDQRHYWCANTKNANQLRYYLPGDPCSSKIAGSNAFQDYHLCSILYSAKPNPTQDKPLRQFGITDDDIQRSREYEDLIQIAFRSSLRLPQSTVPVEVRVYDMQQAEFLRDYLLGAGFDLDIDLIYEDIGINHIVRGKGGHPDPTKGMSEIEVTQFVDQKKKTAAQKAQERRDLKKAEMIAAGTYKPVGRPRKEAQ
jgi:hypothetical protein